MMKKSYMIAFAAAVMSLLSCVKEVAVETISLGNSDLYVEVGNTLEIEVTIVPSTASKASLTWIVDDPSVASVSDGVVSAHKVGVTNVTARAESGVIAKTRIHVTPVITGMELPSNLTVYVGGPSPALKPVFTPAEASATKISWSSADPSIATVSANGTVTAVSVGYTDVTAAYGQFTAVCRVKVREPFEATGVSLAPVETELLIGNGNLQLSASVEPASSATTGEYDMEWTSSDESVATVDQNGLVTPVSEGNVTVTVTVDRKVSAECVLTIIQPIRGVTLDVTEKTLYVGNEPMSLTATVLTDYETADKTVIWHSSAPSVASVENGTVTPVGSGTATITVTTLVGGYSASCAVTVIRLVESIVLDRTELSLNPGVSQSLVATVTPMNATDRTLIWSSSDESVAVVDRNGLVTGGGVEAVGKTAVITVRSKDGAAEAACTVTLTLDVTGVTLDSAVRRVAEGEVFGLVHTLSPANATEKGVSWSTSDPSVATVDDNGVVTAHAQGVAVITVTTEQYGYTAACRVVVRGKEQSDLEGFEEENDFELGD